MNHYFRYYFVYLLIILSLSNATEEEQKINRSFTQSGSIESLIDLNMNYKELILVQLDLINDSLYNIVDSNISELELNIGPATYHRVFPIESFNRLEDIISEDSYQILKRDYQLPNSSRQYWVELKQGSETHGTYTEDDAISYTCDCIGGASDCVKLGWYSWYNPLDYWGEAWWGFSPPVHTYVNEIRVTVRGAQCDDLPLWSETYMGMRDNNGNWSQDYELSIQYADNIFVVPETWSEGMLMPIVGSEDNYVVDQVTLQFFYTCLTADSPNFVVSSDGNYCNHINISWEAPDDMEGIIGYNLYRDQELVTQLDINTLNFSDYSAVDNVIHEYCVSSINECGESELSCNSGYLMSLPSSTDNVYASDGDYSDFIIIDWNPSNGASSFIVYRDGVWLGVEDGSSDFPQYIDNFIEQQEVLKSAACKNSKLEIKIIDTGAIGSGLGVFVEEVAALIEADHSQKELDIIINKQKPLIHSIICINNLYHIIDKQNPSLKYISEAVDYKTIGIMTPSAPISKTGLIRTGSFHGTRTSAVEPVALVAMICPSTLSRVIPLCSISIHAKS